MRSLMISMAVVVAILPWFEASQLQAADPPSAVGSMLKLLKSGRVPENRLGTIVKLVCSRGNEHDLQFVFSQMTAPDHWPQTLRQEALEWLRDAATTRNVVPAGDLTGLAVLIDSDQPQMRTLAIELSGLWKVKSASTVLRRIVESSESEIPLRESAASALAAIDPGQAEEMLEGLARDTHPFEVRAFAVAVMASLDVQKAAGLASGILAGAEGRDNPGPMIDAFLDRQNGSRVLADALAKIELPADIAKLALRHIYSVGRTDAELSRILSEAAGISENMAPPTKAEIAAIVREAEEQGDAVRGEAVFRRNDLSCMKCHAVSKAGGQIGPDLSAIGASSPVEYLVASVLDPDQAIKEAFTTKVVLTVQGKIYQGIVADRTSDALVLKDANGKLATIPLDDIDDEIEGKSLMPKGLVKFMTHAELVDLVKFLSSLGKPGRYAIRSTQRMQRWRLLTNVPDELVSEVPELSSFEDLVLRATTWEPAYARVNGELPLGELAARTGQDVIYVQGELKVSRGGPIEVQLDSAQGVQVWIGDHEAGSRQMFVADLPEGLHPVTLRIDLQVRESTTVTLEFTRPQGSHAEFAVVDGQ